MKSFVKLLLISLVFVYIFLTIPFFFGGEGACLPFKIFCAAPEPDIEKGPFWSPRFQN